VPAGTPSGIFSSERWGCDPNNEMSYTLNAPAGHTVDVRLYFANQYGGTSQVGQRVFSVAIDGTPELTNYDIVADVGNEVATMHDFTVTVPPSGQVTVAFSHSNPQLDNPLVNGLELVDQSVAAPGPGAYNTLTSVPFNGTTAGTPTAQPTIPGFDLSGVRGAFVVGSTLYFGYTDGNLYQAPINALTESIGTPIVVNPYVIPFWSTIKTGSGCGEGGCTLYYTGVPPTLYGSEMQNVTGMVYANGNLYYTLFGSSTLYWRAFEPDGGVVGSQEFSAPVSDLGSVAGMFLSGSTLYYASAVDGSLHSVAWNNGAPDPTTDTVVSSPASGGPNWATDGAFVMPTVAPTASFTTTCSALVCSFNASASTAPGSAIASYSWTFGDGNSTTGATATDTYATGGTYPVTLTVTTAAGLTATSTQQVTAAAALPPISFVNQTSVAGTGTADKVAVPAGVTAGDGLVLIATGAASSTMTAPAGWTQVGSGISNAGVRSTVWERVATAADAGSTVTVTLPTAYKSTVQLLAYANTAASGPVDGALWAGTPGSTSTSSLATPVVNGVGGAGDWVVSYWAAKSSAVTTITAPASVTVRGTAGPATTSGRINSLVADSNGPVASGSVGGLVASFDQPASSTATWTLALAP